MDNIWPDNIAGDVAYDTQRVFEINNINWTINVVGEACIISTSLCNNFSEILRKINPPEEGMAITYIERKGIITPLKTLKEVS